MSSEAQLYRDLGATPVINAAGNHTVIGGSRISPTVQEAMVAAIEGEDIERVLGDLQYAANRTIEQ